MAGIFGIGTRHSGGLKGAASATAMDTPGTLLYMQSPDDTGGYGGVGEFWYLQHTSATIGTSVAVGNVALWPATAAGTSNVSNSVLYQFISGAPDTVTQGYLNAKGILLVVPVASYYNWVQRKGFCGKVVVTTAVDAQGEPISVDSANSTTNGIAVPCITATLATPATPTDDECNGLINIVGRALNVSTTTPSAWLEIG